MNPSVPGTRVPRRPRRPRGGVRPAGLILLAGLAAGALAAAVWFARLPSRWDDDRRPPPGFEIALDAFDEGRIEEGVERIAGVRREWTHPRWDRRADALEAFWSVRIERWERAEESAGRIAAAARRAAGSSAAPEEGDPLAAPALMLRATALARLGRPGEAAAAAAPLAGRFDRSAWGAEALETWAVCEADAGRREGAIARLEEAIAGGSAPAPERLALLAARLRRDGGDLEGAARALKDLFAGHPRTAAADQALEMLETLPDGAGAWSAADLPLLERRARNLLDAGDSRRAVETWRLALSRIPEAASDARVRALRGIALAEDRQYAAAAPLLPPALPGDAALARDVLIARARCEIARHRRSRAAALLQPMLASTAAREDRLRAETLLATAADDAGDDAEALRRYRTILALAEPSPRHDQLFWRAGWLSVSAGRHEEALAIFRKLDRPDAHPGHRAASLYWSARAEELRGRRDRARRLFEETLERYRNDYYGLRAAARLRGSGSTRAPRPAASAGPGAGEAPTAGPPGPRAAGTDPFAGMPAPEPSGYEPPARLAVSTALEFETVHLWGEAARAYAFALRFHGSDRRLNLRLADLALLRGDRAAAVPHLRAAYDDLLSATEFPLPDRHREALYPREPAETIRAAARRRSLDVHLVHALILQESAYNPLAVSRAGARGLMQIMPGTGADLARQAGERGFDPQRLFEPDLNVDLGTRYLSEMLRRFDGRVEKALAAYNAGPGRVERWWARGRGDTERFVEEIPLTETRLYVKRVLANRRMYALLYPS